MKRARRIFLLILASLSLSGCGGSRELTFSSDELTFSEVEEKMEYVLMSDDVDIEFYTMDKYGKIYYGIYSDKLTNIYFKARLDDNGNYVSYAVITSDEYYFIMRGDNVYGEQ